MFLTLMLDEPKNQECLIPMMANMRGSKITGAVHQIRELPGYVAWRKFLDLIGFPDIGMEELQVLLRQGYERAKRMGYKQGGRRDHA